MAYNSPYSQYWQDFYSRRANEVSSSHIEDQISTLTSLVRQMISQNAQKARTCRICASPSHPTNCCLRLPRNSYEYANSVGGFLCSEQRHYDSYSHAFNQEWSAYSDYGYGAHSQGFQHYQPEQPMMPEQSSSDSGMFLEEIVKSLATNILQFQQETRSRLQDLETQLSQLASSVKELKIIADLEDDDSLITLTSGEEEKEYSNIVDEYPSEDEIVEQGFAHYDITNEENKVVEIFHKIEEPKAKWQPTLDFSPYILSGEGEIESIMIATDPPDVREDFHIVKVFAECKGPLNGFLNERRGIG